MDISFEMMSTAENAKYDLEKADLMLNEAIEMNTKNKQQGEESEYDDEMHIWIASDYVQKAMEQLEKIIMIWTRSKEKKGGK